MKKKITKDTTLGELISVNPNAGEILFEYGLHCIGCGLASVETLEQGCRAHGMGDKEIREILDKLNNKKKKSKKKAKKKIKDAKYLKEKPQTTSQSSAVATSNERKKIEKNIKKLPKEKKLMKSVKEMLG